ncbi:Stf0 family sulfotransferase [Stackebrandtia soli]|uniref:Stf0 family sulfotransferase n=1 Tax=Stackebrandtia soli TaxID=1892856 RepID=UPI0039E811B4
MSPNVDAYFVCATPRTGSSLLLGLLGSTGVAGHPQAYFRSPDEPLWADRWALPRTGTGGIHYPAFVRAAIAAGSTDNGVFAAKLMWGTLAELVAKLGSTSTALDHLASLTEAFGRVGFVYLRRENAVAQAVSWLRAEQTDTWYIGGAGEIGGNGTNGGEPRFDASRIAELVGEIDDHNAGWVHWFDAHDVEPHVITYGGLDADPAGTTRGVLDHLGIELPPETSIRSRHHRQADALNDEWIERFHRHRQAQDDRPGPATTATRSHHRHRISPPPPDLTTATGSHRPRTNR